MDKLVDLAQQVGGKAWPLLVKGVFNNSLTAVIIGVLATIFIATLGRYLYQKAEEEGRRLVVFIYVLAGCALALGISASFLPGLINPEAAAVVRVLSGHK